MEDISKILEMHCDNITEALEKMAHQRVNMANNGEAEKVYYLLKSLITIDKLMEDDTGYSGDGEWQATGNYTRDGYDGGNSYARRSMHFVRGHYSRANGRDNYGTGNSRDFGGGMSFDRMMDVADPTQRRMLEDLRRKANM